MAHEAAHGFGRPPLLNFTAKARKNHSLWKGLMTDTQYNSFFTITVIIKMNNHNGGFLLHNLLSLQTFKKPQTTL